VVCCRGVLLGPGTCYYYHHFQLLITPGYELFWQRVKLRVFFFFGLDCREVFVILLLFPCTHIRHPIAGTEDARFAHIRTQQSPPKKNNDLTRRFQTFFSLSARTSTAIPILAHHAQHPPPLCHYGLSYHCHGPSHGLDILQTRPLPRPVVQKPVRRQDMDIRPLTPNLVLQLPKRPLSRLRKRRQHALCPHALGR